MDKDLFEYEMKKAGYRTVESRADAWGMSLQAYYRRVNNECECTKSDMRRIIDLLGIDTALRIFFGEEVAQAQQSN